MSKKLFVGNLDYSTTNEQLVKMFESYGPLEEVRIIMDRMTNRSKGFGFVTCTDDAMADKAIAELNGKQLENGMTLKVDVAKPMEDRPKRSFGGGGYGGGSGGRGFGSDRPRGRGFSRRDDNDRY